MAITLKWYTGRMEIIDSAILNMRPAQLSQIVKTATENAEEAKAQIAALINEEIGNWHKDSEYGKKRIAELKKLLDVVDGRKLTKVEKAVQRIIKNVDDCRPDYKGVFESAGKSCVTDGYRLVRYAAPLDCFETVNPGFDVSRAIGDISAYSVRLELPDVKELKADIKLAKIGKMDAGRVHYGGGMNSVMYDFGYGLPAVDAKFLVDMLEALPDCAAFCKPGKNPAPIYFVSGEDDGILLPIKKHQEWEAAPVEQAAPAVEEVPATVEDPAPVDTAEEERARREDQERLDRERAIADELAKAEQAIMNGGYVENKMLYGKCVFLRLFDKHGIDLPIRSRGWAINKLRGFEQHNDGMITIRYSQTRKNEKISDRCFAAYCKLRELLKAKEAERQQQEEQEVPAAVEMPALERVLAVAAAVNDGAHDSEAIADYLNLYGKEMITEDEAKSALLRYTVPLALPAHEEAAQATETPAAVSSVVVINPVFLAACARLYAHAAGSGFSGGVPGCENVRTSPTFCEVSLHNTS